jgi:replicative DNA helicase
MKRLLRSIIDIKGSITQENLVFNFTKLKALVDGGRFAWARPDDLKVYNFVYQYFSAQLEMPSVATVRDYFERLDDLEATERIKDVEAADFHIRTNFSYLLGQLVEEQRRLSFVAILKEAHDIATKGVEVKGRDEKLIGIEAAYQRVIEGGRLVLDAVGQPREDHDIRAEGPIVRQEYEDAEAHPEKRLGAFTGLLEVDSECGGIRNGELWVHGAYPGELKSSLAMNVAYNLVTRYRRNAVYVSLEMPDEQVRRGVYAIHSENPKWPKAGIAMGPLDYRKIRDGGLSKEERAFFLDLVIPDFEKNPKYCEFHVFRPSREKTTIQVQQDLELLDRDFEVGFVVLDHGQWLEPQKHRRNKDYTIELNAIIRECKAMAMTFAGGRKVPVLLLWQINREGKEDADKHDGQYKLKGFTYANEIEKTADVVTTSYLNDELRALNLVRLGNLKNRDNPKFKTFDARVQWGPRRITTIERCGSPDSGIEVELANV